MLPLTVPVLSAPCTVSVPWLVGRMWPVAIHLALHPLFLCPTSAVDCFTSLRITYAPDLTCDSSKGLGRSKNL